MSAGSGAADGLVHDAADRAGASPTLRTAPEAAVDLVGRSRTRRRAIKRGPHVAVTENVAGTNDHRGIWRHPGSTNLDLSHARAACKKKNALLRDSKVLIRLALIALLPQRPSAACAQSLAKLSFTRSFSGLVDHAIAQRSDLR